MFSEAPVSEAALVVLNKQKNTNPTLYTAVPSACQSFQADKGMKGKEK